MEANETLKRLMADRGLTRGELAHRLNRAIEEQFGYYGTVTERTVYLWTSGRSRMPQAKQRRALTAVFGCTLEEIGFHPPSRVRHNSAPQEDPVRRREFLTVGTVAAALPAVTALSSVGAADVARLRNHLDQLVTTDDQYGGNTELVRAAMAGAAETLKLAQQPTSERIRSRLYSLAAEFTTTAAFACIDSLALAEAQTHLNRAAILAGLSRSSVVQAQVWNLFSMAAFYDGRPSEAVTAAQAAADKLTRSDPEFAALGFARAAHGYAAQGDRQAALRSIGRAFDLLDRTTNVEPRPSWAAFLGRGEIEALAARLYHQLNIPQKAEEASHRALSVTPLGFQRNRAQVTFHLAKAQLRQGEPELACVSARDVLNSVGGEPLPRRLLTLATEFHRELVATVPTLPAVSEWREVARLRQRGQA